MGGAPFGHTERVLDVAAAEDALGEWSFDVANPRVLVKTAPTARTAWTSEPARREAAADLPTALRLSDPRKVQGKRTLLYDDVCTTGNQFNVVAGYLIDAGGAVHVEGVVLARATATNGSCSKELAD